MFHVEFSLTTDYLPVTTLHFNSSILKSRFCRFLRFRNRALFIKIVIWKVDMVKGSEINEIHMQNLAN